MSSRTSIGVALMLQACSLLGTDDLRNEGAGGDGAGAGASGGGPSSCGPCDDANPCTADRCEDGACVHESESFALPNEDSTDCVVQSCVDGVLTTTPDDTEIPGQTGSVCEKVVCGDGQPRTVQSPDGTVCGDDLQVCRAGLCGFPCQSTLQCPDPVEPCVERIRCESTFCVATLVDRGDEVEQEFQPDGDCQELLCTGSATEVRAEFDVTDQADDGSACTIDTCSAPNVTTHTALPDLSPCDGGGVCRGGVCGACQSTSDCNDNYFGPNCLAPGHCGCTLVFDCESNRYCDATSVCSLKKPPGAACNGNVECVSGGCAGGVCN